MFCISNILPQARCMALMSLPSSMMPPFADADLVVSLLWHAVPAAGPAISAAVTTAARKNRRRILPLLAAVVLVAIILSSYFFALFPGSRYSQCSLISSLHIYIGRYSKKFHFILSSPADTNRPPSPLGMERGKANLHFPSPRGRGVRTLESAG